MCFSATGSFAVGAVIAGIGVVGVVRKKPPSHRMLAAVPLLFAAQQVTEGVVWMTLGHPSGWAPNLIAVAVFLIFASVVWPIWVPLSLLMAESIPQRRRALKVLTSVGVVVSAYAVLLLTRGRPTAHMAGHCLAYCYASSGRRVVLALVLPGYALPSVLSFFVSTVSKAKIMGVVLTLALVATFVIERRALASVWCFFAAILSAVLVLGVGEDHRLVIKIA